MVNTLEEEPRKYTSKEIDLARKDGWKRCENQYSKQNLVIENNKLKEEIKQLNKKIEELNA